MTTEVSPLDISVDVHLDDTVDDSSLDFLLAGAGATVEDEEEWLLVLAGGLLTSVLLVVAEDLRGELDVAWLVNTVDITEGRGDREGWGDGGEGLVDLVDLLWLGHKAGGVGGLVVDTVFFTTGDTDLHFEPLAHLGHAGEVLDAGADVLLVRLLTQVKHVGGEERNAVDLVVSLVGIEHAVEPREELLGAVVGVEDNWDTVERGDGAYVVGKSDRAGDRGLLLVVWKTLTSEEGTTAVGNLENDWGFDVACSLEDSVGDGGGGNVDGWHGVLVGAGVFK